MSTTYTSTAPVVNKTTQRLVLGVLYFILIVAAFLSLVPFYWMLMSSFKPLNDILTIPVWVIPQHFTLDNYSTLLTETLFLRSMLNTMAVAGSNVILQVLFCSMAGFAFAKYRFKGRKFLFTLVLGT
ncbi:MAG: carbohydrate ABC transporter permease, partial [Anaerolineae bacterium]|nr:carbohydrate ABC transporter permease [Anaerolineae bacterium]